MKPAWSYRPVSASARRRRAKSARNARPLTHAQAWDAGGVPYAKLSEAEYLEKTLSSLSPNDVLARSTLLRRLTKRAIAPLELELSTASGSAVLRVVKEQVRVARA